MTLQLLAQSLAVVQNPQSNARQLHDVVGDLVAFGAFDAADKAVRLLRAKGAQADLLQPLEQRIERGRRSVAPERFLAVAVAVAQREDATEQQLLRAAEGLVVWGALDEADRALARLSSNHELRGPVARLRAASHQLRRSGIFTELQALTPEKSLNKPYEVLVRRREGARRTILVFTGAARRFWLSLNALHLFIRNLDAHVIYLSDQSFCMYLNGLASVGPGYQSMLDMLKEQLRKLGSKDIFVLANSAGGFVALRTAVDLQAESFAGLSIPTSLERSQIQDSSYLKRAMNACRYPEMLIDLRPLIEAAEFPRRIALYCGEENVSDRASAEHFSGIDRVEVNYLPGHRRHDLVSALIARGEFHQMLRRLVGDQATEGPVAAAS